MWPKMLFDLLPHFARLMPMADKYLSNRSASEKTQETALSALAENVRGELAKSTEANAGLRRQMQEQTTQIADMAVEVTRARMGVETVEARVAKLENSISAAELKALVAGRLLRAAVALLIVALALLLILVVRGMR